ncbi:MAG: glucosamine-6-phosphate deaminase [Clostridiaceae bacterium]|nr:glucosamine-6-phosphate deaminase [Clostridiaceae bacterium]MDE7035384.1 glucosamine-6-phosphate deaminase [Eubacteriales bacterium]NBH79338.1 glucosamine-6-phosphate deaminase [Clostridiaceae bacterium]
MNIIVCRDYEEMSRKAVELVAESLRETPEGLVSFAGGDTPLGTVHTFAEQVNAGAIDISRAHYVSLDEWVGLSDTDEGSCGLFNRVELLGRLEKPFAGVHVINGAAADIEAERQALNDYIAKYGPLTASVLGIGMNGHLGFNEDGIDFESDAHITPLSDVTKRVMCKYFGEKFHPEYGISQGIRQIMAAKRVILIANGAHKAEILSRAVRGEVTNSVPASILQRHPDCYVVADTAAAAGL